MIFRRAIRLPLKTPLSYMTTERDAVSTIVCNWFGAGSAGLADPDSDSSIQSYANIYDINWLIEGNHDDRAGR